MALLYLLGQVKNPKTKIHALTFDHGLRKDSATEAQKIGEWVKDWPGVEHHVLKWKGKKPETSIMEKAREARYAQLCKWCVGQGIDELWLGHHQTDQVETFLFRLAKGSGLDGLGGMAERQPYAETGVMLVRPLLQFGKKTIEDFCDEADIPYVRDPTNVDMKYARSRLRHALPVLETEGLSESRLAGTVRRLDRAREALDFYADKIMRSAVIIGDDETAIKMKTLEGVPEEMRIRVIRRVLAAMGRGGYGPRLDRLEQLLEEFFADVPRAKQFTLGGYLFSHDRKKQAFLIRRQR